MLSLWDSPFFTIFSISLTDKLSSIIFLAKNSEFFNPTRALACPLVSLPSFKNIIMLSGSDNSLKEFAI